MNAPVRVVVCSLEAWDDVWRRNQHLLDTLLRHDDSLEVLVIEPAADPFHALSHAHRPRRGTGLREIAGYNGRLRAFQPTKYAPRALGPGAQSLMRSQVLRAVDELGWSRPILWINDPMWVSLLATGWPSLYDITDDWVSAKRSARVHERIVAADSALLAGVGAVVVCSPALLERKGGTLVRNGVDVEAYRRPTERPVDLPAGRIALYVGTLHEDRLDVSLVVKTAERLAYSGASLVLVGPDALSREHSARLHSARGLHVLGSRPAPTIPAYMQHADALVAPHIVDSFTASLDPIKLYEYLAAGRPVVSTPVAGFSDVSSTRGIVLTEPDGFAEAVARVVSNEHPTVTHDDIPNWAESAEKMMAVLHGIGVGVSL